MSTAIRTATSRAPRARTAGETRQARRRPPIGPIVAAVGPKDSSLVLRAGRFFAELTNNEVLALAAIEPLPIYYPAEAPMLLTPELNVELQEERSNELAREVEAAGGARSGWTYKVLVGNAARTVADVARAERSPLVIMGIGRHRPVDRLLSHETALHTLRAASCPVLAIAEPFDPPFREVVIATDFSATSANAAQAAMPLLADGAVVHLVHVWQPINRSQAMWHEIDDQYRAAMPERFRRFRSLLQVPAGIVIKEETREGRNAEGLLKYATTQHADLIVAGRRGLNPLTRFLVGSTTTALLRGAACSVLVAPESAIPDPDHLDRVLTGTVELHAPKAWAAQLDEFTERNRSRIAMLEVEEPDLGAQVLETGYAFDGATWDEKDQRLALMLSAATSRTRHVTHSIRQPSTVSIAAGPDGRDVALRIAHGEGGGQTLLTLASD